MNAAVADASVLVKLLTAEEDSDRADRVMRQHQVIAPEFVLAEIGNTIWSRIHGGLNLDIAVDLLTDALALPLDLRPIRPLMPRALTIAAATDHPIYDCIYLALAEELDLPLFTADGRFIRAVRRSNFATVNLMALAQLA